MHRHSCPGRGRTKRQQGLQRHSPALLHSQLVPARRNQGTPDGLERSAHHGRRCGGHQGANQPQPGAEQGGSHRAPAGAGGQRSRAAQTPQTHQTHQKLAAQAAGHQGHARRCQEAARAGFRERVTPYCANQTEVHQPQCTSGQWSSSSWHGGFTTSCAVSTALATPLAAMTAIPHHANASGTWSNTSQPNRVAKAICAYR